MFNLAPFGYILFGKLNESTSLSIASGLVNMTIIIGTVLVGVFIFHDALTTKQIIGLLFAILAVALMS
jgi:multidrug transporter EmrE-like cation transporter